MPKGDGLTDADRRRFLATMNHLALLMAALAGGVLLAGRKPAPSGTVLLEPGKHYRLTFDAPFSVAGDSTRTDIRFELLPLSAYDVSFVDGADGQGVVEFTVMRAAPVAVTLGSPLNDDGALGKMLVLRSVRQLAPGGLV